MPRLRLLFAVGLFWLSCHSIAQTSVKKELEQYKVFTSLNEALLSPDSVFRLSLTKNKLRKVPADVFRFRNLKELNLSKNKLQEIPPGIENLPNLISLNLSKNYLPSLPPEIGSLGNLILLDVSQNYINKLPPEIGKLSKLEEFLLWQNEIVVLPPEISKLKQLRKLDMRLIYMNDKRKKTIENLLPNTELFFSNSCNCNTPD
ncbi:MAG: leucine-rich repeat domain-containing protein [Bacteroidota bacterium]